MLFDLRGRGRRRTVQGIYLGLAVLMGGGLIFFGVGGTGVGLFNTGDNNGGSGSGNDVLEKQLARAEKAVRMRPRDPGAWAALARERFTSARQGENYNEAAKASTAQGRVQLRKAGDAWKRYLALDPKRVDLNLARTMSLALSEIGDAKGVVGALEILVERTPNPQDFADLAVAAYAAGQDRKSDLAAAEAVRRAPKAVRGRIRADIAARKARVKQGATAGAPGGGAAPVQPQPKGAGVPVQPQPKGAGVPVQPQPKGGRTPQPKG